MNDKNNFIPRHGNSLFYPHDPSEGFQGGSGGLSRRKFLKRTGGATAAAFLASIPVKLEAHEAGESEEWDMDHAGYFPEGLGGLRSKGSAISWTTPGEDGEGQDYHSLTLKLEVFSTPALGADIFDTLEIEIVSMFTLYADTGTTFGESASNQANTAVICDSSNGHIAFESTPGDGQLGAWPVDTTDFTYEGKTFRLAVTSVIAGQSGNPHSEIIVATAQGSITELDANNNPLTGGIYQLIPDTPLNAAAPRTLSVSNFFQSKEIS